MKRGLGNLPGKTGAEHQIGLIGAQQRLDRILVAREEKIDAARCGGVGQHEVGWHLPAVVAARPEDRDRLVTQVAQGADERIREGSDRADRADTQALRHLVIL